MTNLHILSDPVTDFWKCPKKGFLKSDFWHFLKKMLVPYSATRLAAPVTLAPHRVEYGVSHLLTPSSSLVLYCNVLYCTVHCHIATLPHCAQPLCPDIVSKHCVQTLCQDIVSVNSMSVACCWVASPGGGIQRALQVAEGHQPSAGARSSSEIFRDIHF